MSKLTSAFLSHVFSRKEVNKKGLQIASAILGYSFFIVFFVIAWVYYKERMIPFDGAFYCFKMIDSKWFNLELGRVGAVFTQILPCFSLYLGLELETVIRLYSINFIAVQFLIFIWLFYKLKDYKAVLALLLALCLGYRYQFYYTVSEIHQTIAPLVLMFGLMSSSLLFSKTRREHVIFFVSFVCICFLLANIHILSLVLITFIVTYAIVENRQLLLKKELWLSIVVGYSFFAYKILSIEAGSYDASKMLTADKIKITLTQLTSIPSFLFFKEEFLNNYYILIFATFILFGLYIFQKKWVSLLYIGLSLVGFFILIIAYNITNDSPVIYQNYYACIGLIVAIPLVVELVAVFQLKIVVGLVACLLITSTVKIVQCGRMYELRMEYFSRMEQNVKGLPESKFMVSTDNINFNMIWMDWNIGFESLLHSSLASPDSAMTFTAASQYSDYDSMMYKPNTFIGVRFSPYWFTSDHMSQRYFRIKNTPYRILNKIPQDSLSNSKFNSSNLNLDFTKDAVTSLPYFRYQIIPVEIRNNSNDTLFSKDKYSHVITLGYKLYSQDGALIHAAPSAVSIELDVYPHTEIITGLELNYLKRGTYTLEIDAVYERSKWLNIGKKKTITIY